MLQLRSHLKYLRACGCSILQVTKIISELFVRELFNNLCIWGKGDAQTFKTVVYLHSLKFLKLRSKKKKKTLK